jgi:PleD family two-component response regulator
MTEDIKKPMILIIDDAMTDIKVLGTTLQPDYNILFAAQLSHRMAVTDLQVLTGNF